jgi:hypothetical protein
MIPTAEEFFRNKIKEWEGTITLWKVPLNTGTAMRWAQEYSILKAKLHVKAALEQASERADITDNGRFPIIDKPSILNSYNLDNIK